MRGLLYLRNLFNSLSLVQVAFLRGLHFTLNSNFYKSSLDYEVLEGKDGLSSLSLVPTKMFTDYWKSTRKLAEIYSLLNICEASC